MTNIRNKVLNHDVYYKYLNLLSEKYNINYDVNYLYQHYPKKYSADHLTNYDSIETIIYRIRNNKPVNWDSISYNSNIIYIMKKCNDNYFESYKSRLDWSNVSSNKYAIPLIKKALKDDIFKKHISWEELSGNPNAIHILEKNMDKIDWNNLSGNPKAIHILEQNFDKINWSSLSSNPNAIHILEQNLDKVDWKKLLKNPNLKNPNAIHILEQNLDKIDICEFSKNPNAVHYWIQNQNRINWIDFSRNPSPLAIKLLKNNLDKIDWTGLSGNKSALSILINNLDKIKLDYIVLNEKAHPILDIIIDVVYKPTNKKSIKYIEKYRKHNINFSEMLKYIISNKDFNRDFLLRKIADSEYMIYGVFIENMKNIHRELLSNHIRIE